MAYSSLLVASRLQGLDVTALQVSLSLFSKWCETLLKQGILPDVRFVVVSELLL